MRQTTSALIVFALLASSLSGIRVLGQQVKQPARNKPISGSANEPASRGSAEVLFALTVDGMRRELPYQYILLDVDVPGQGFQRLDTDLGWFLVILDDVAPYLDGHRLNLRIGNPSYATFNRFVLKLEWGPAFPLRMTPKKSEDRRKVDEWEARLRRQDFSFTVLEPGSWNSVSITLAPSRPADIKFLRLRMEVQGISLRKIEKR